MKHKGRAKRTQLGGIGGMGAALGAINAAKAVADKIPLPTAPGTPSSPPATTLAGDGGGQGDKCPSPDTEGVENAKMFWEKLKLILSTIWSVTKDFLRSIRDFFNSSPGKYITLIIFLILIFVGIGFLIFSSNSPLRSSQNGRFGQWANQMAYRYNVDTSWLYKLKFKTNEDSVPKFTRKSQTGGRCNGVSNMEMNDTQCLNLDIPKTIKWDLDVKDIPEWDSLPPMIQEKLSRRGYRLTIHIPWDLNGTQYTPNCSKAYFGDGTSAGHLFQNMDGYCQRVVKSAKEYTPARMRVYSNDDGEPMIQTDSGEPKVCTL